MRIKGKELGKPNIEIITFPRGTTPEEAIVLQAEAIMSYDDFNKFCPEPKAPKMLLPGGKKGKKVENTEDLDYKKAVAERDELRTAWTVITSLKATPGLTWDTVKLEDSSTWHLYEKELEDAGLTAIEVGKITLGVMSANGLDESRVKEARDHFLASQSAKETS